MAQVAGYSSKNRRRDQRRPVPLEATLDGHPVLLFDLSLSGVGAGTVDAAVKKRMGDITGSKARLSFTDTRGREVDILIEISYFLEDGRFGGRFYNLSGEEFDVVQDLMFRRHRPAAE